jgi:hypothetical protein
VGSPDASAGVPRDKFSIRYAGEVLARFDGPYTFSADTDGRAQLLVDGRPVVTKETEGRATASGTITLVAGTHSVSIRYAHGTGPVSLHVTWSGPGFPGRVLEPASHPPGI